MGILVYTSMVGQGWPAQHEMWCLKAAILGATLHLSSPWMSWLPAVNVALVDIWTTWEVIFLLLVSTCPDLSYHKGDPNFVCRMYKCIEA